MPSDTKERAQELVKKTFGMAYAYSVEIATEALQSEYERGSWGEFDRGWRQAKAEIAAALGCDWRTLYADELWALKVKSLMESEYDRGRREAAERAAKQIEMLELIRSAARNVVTEHQADGSGHPEDVEHLRNVLDGYEYMMPNKSGEEKA